MELQAANATMADDGEQPWKIPPIVQELAAAREPPSRYVVAEKDRPAVAGVAMPEPIPIVDLSRLSSSAPAADDEAEATKLRSALQNWGLFLAVGHGMEPDLLAEMLKVTRDFYRLPLEEKQRYSNLVKVDGGKREFRMEGYGNDVVVAENQVLDWCDRFYLVVEPESRKDHSLWPTQPPSFSEVLREYTVKCRGVADLVLASMAKLVGLHEGYFVGMMHEEEATTYARFNYYPRCARPDRVLGLKPHSDGSVITVVFVDDTVSGLQVQGTGDGDGVWYDVPLLPNALLVNVGDTMEILSNGLFKSPVHRVVTNGERERVSLVMFYQLDPDKEMEPATELVDDKHRPRLYGRVKAKDYLTELCEKYSRGTRAIDTVKLKI